MGKKGSWFSAIKRVFVTSSKDKLIKGPEKQEKAKKKNKVLGKLSHGDRSSFIPLFREPSSIEKILGEVEAELEDHKAIFPPSTPSDQPKTQPPPDELTPQELPPEEHPYLQQNQSLEPPNLISPIAVVNNRRPRTPPLLSHPNHHILAATKIQAACRGYMARKSLRGVRGVVRLQGVMRSQSVKRQTMNALKYMQLLVRLQSQIRTRRVTQAAFKMDDNKQVEISEVGVQDEWDDSLLTKEEIDARMQRKVEASLKRERAMAYAYSHQLWNTSPMSVHTGLMDFQSSGFPRWWNWIERQLPLTNPLHPATAKLQTPQKAGAYTPRSCPRSPFPQKIRTPSPFNRFSQQSPRFSKYSKANSSISKDDDSLLSCPPFSVPNYMSPTMSAKAKAKGSNSYEKPASPNPSEDQRKRRLSFPLAQGSGGSFKWNRESPLSSAKDSPSQRMISLRSVDVMSVDSSTSLPVGFERKPFNRFV